MGQQFRHLQFTTSNGLVSARTGNSDTAVFFSEVSKESVILIIMCMIYFGIFFGEFDVTLAEASTTSASSLDADVVIVSIFDKFINTSLSVEIIFYTIKALFVFLAESVNFVHWFTISHIGHWSVGCHQAMTSIIP